MQIYVRIISFVMTSIAIALLLTLINPAHAFDLKKNVVEFRLKNGMRWLLVPRLKAPVFSGVVMVRVGGADEVQGKTGLAHVFEHMAFKGGSEIGTRDFAKEKPILDEIEKVGALLTAELSKSEPDSAKIDKLKEKMKVFIEHAKEYQIKNELWEIMVRNGAADLNAYTSKDVTAYHASMPVNKLALWLSMVSKMIGDPVYREFFTERDVILEERRSGIENNPNGKLSEMILKSSFKEGSYSWPVIGTVEDISSFTVADARNFHDKHYTAGNMVGVLVGDFNVKKSKKLIKKYFNSFPASETKKDEQTSQDKGGGEVVFDFDAEPALVMTYHKPTLPNTDEFVFDVIQVLLCDGPTSRLQKRLVYDEKIARVIYCSDSFPGSRFNNLFLVWAEPNRGYKPKLLVKEITKELDRLKSEPISQKELDRVQKKVTAAIIYTLEQNMGLTMALADFETVLNDWNLLIDYPRMIEKVTAQDVEQIAKKYFTKENETIVIRLRGKKKDESN